MAMPAPTCFAKWCLRDSTSEQDPYQAPYTVSNPVLAPGEFGLPEGWAQGSHTAQQLLPLQAWRPLCQPSPTAVPLTYPPQPPALLSPMQEHSCCACCRGHLQGYSTQGTCNTLQALLMEGWWCLRGGGERQHPEQKGWCGFAFFRPPSEPQSQDESGSFLL